MRIHQSFPQSCQKLKLVNFTLSACGILESNIMLQNIIGKFIDHAILKITTWCETYHHDIGPKQRI